MEREQELEWAEAQKIEISVDLVAAAKKQLKFLAAVDRNRSLYVGPALERAIYRYNACWLPLLAKYSKAEIMMKGPFVVPLDCEWIWHCHRLNPLRYKFDCEEIYGRILDNHNIVSSIQGISAGESEKIWNELFPNEPYEFDLKGEIVEKVPGEGESTKYDLLSAVKRQSPFFYQVSRAHVSSDLFLESAVARYKGFLHLIKRNKEKSLKRFCVPTYDIDLIWHSHQLQPVAYSSDLVALLGKVLEHDDTDSNRSKGMKLDTGFTDTTKQYEDTFGSRYWKAGAMYRGTAPSSVASTPFVSKYVSKQKQGVASNKISETISLPERKIVEVMLEFVGVRNLADGHKGNLSVVFSKTQPDTIFNVKRRLNILSETKEKQVATFHCESTGNLLFELISHSPSNLKIINTVKTLGSTSISLDDFLSPVTTLSVEKWLELDHSDCVSGSKPMELRFAISFTIPTVAPHVLHMVRSRPFSKGFCFFPLSKSAQFSKTWTRVVDEAGNEVISLQMREFKKGKAKDSSIRNKEVIGITNSGKTHTLAELLGTEWLFKDSKWSLQLTKTPNKVGHLLELTGQRMVKLFLGRKLEYELKNCEKNISENDVVTIIAFSAEDPYGRAVAMLDMKSGFFTVKEEWLVLPATIINFILSDILRKEGYEALTSTMDNFNEIENKEADVGHDDEGGEMTELALEKDKEPIMEVVSISTSTLEEGIVLKGGCGGSGGCGSGCGNTLKSGGCGSGGCGGGGCGNTLKSGGCGGGGCGSGGCGNGVESGGCGGGGCGGGCGNGTKSGGCGGGGCGGGCGNRVESGDCGGGGCGGCGGGCGNRVESGSGCGGGGCGGGCGNRLESGGGGCGNGAKSGGCGGGGCGGGECGNGAKSGGCGGGGCGGGCGNKM